jgi:glutathionylspermidine synthase
MQRVDMPERPDWKEQATATGCGFLAEPGESVWDESACYRFSLRQIEDDIESPTQALLGMCYQAVDYAIERPELLSRLAIPEFVWNYLGTSWRRQDKDLYGRFDLCYDGSGPAKLYEFNADTPTALFEAAVFQWQWLEQAIERGLVPRDADQFNSIHERLIAAFHDFGFAGRTLHVACVRDHAEDRGTVEYLADCARQAGIVTEFVHIEEIGITGDGHLTDLADRVITDLFKLYPWEWLVAEEFGHYLPRDLTRIIEPVWKMILSNKGILAILWEMFPDHPNLLPAFFAGDSRTAGLREGFVTKPLLGREGGNIEIEGKGTNDPTVRRAGPYGSEGHVVQALCTLPQFGENYPVIGSWIVAGQASGMGIREERALITTNTARFVPHVIIG